MGLPRLYGVKRRIQINKIIMSTVCNWLPAALHASDARSVRGAVRTMEEQLAQSGIPSAYHSDVSELLSSQAFTASEHIILTACVDEDELEEL